jgi:LPS export ABC transporter permease LptG
MARRGGLAVGASYSIFFFIVYWAFLIGGENLADRLIISPATAMWSANVIIGLCGIYLVARMVRETTVLRFDPLLAAWHAVAGRVRRNPLTRAALAASRFVMKAPVWALNRAAGILPAYLVRLFIGYLIGVVAALVVIFVVVDYISNLRSFENAGARDIVLYYWYYLHWFILVIAPIAILLATMFAVGRMAKYSELTALKAAGIGIQRFAVPLLFIGVLLSGASFYFGERVLPDANAARIDLREEIREGRHGGARRRAGGAFHRNFYYFGNSNTVYRFGEFRTRPQVSKSVWRERFRDNRIIERIRADRMEYRDDGVWQFVNARVRRFRADSSTVEERDTLADSLLTASPEEMVTRLKGVDEMSYWELSDAIELARRRGEKVHTYLADLHFKIALPFMNFIVIVLGLSVTARAGRTGGATLFGIGLMLTFSYWIVSRFSLAMGQNGRLDPMLAAWGGNALFFLIGLILFRKASR